MSERDIELGGREGGRETRRRREDWLERETGALRWMGEGGGGGVKRAMFLR